MFVLAISRSENSGLSFLLKSWNAGALNHLVFHGFGLVPRFAALENLMSEHRPSALLFVVHHVALSVFNLRKRR